MVEKAFGILDPEGENINPLTGKEYSENYKKYATSHDNPLGAIPWTKLPVYSKRDEFIEAIENNNVILVVSGTGSGKSVLLPKYALHALNYKGAVVLTNPKTLATRTNAEYAAKCLDVELGKEVGYKYKDAPKKSYSKDTKLLFSTDGSVLASLIHVDPLLKKYDVVIIDEAHERTVIIDILLYKLKHVLKQRPDFKLIIMSATINKDIFKNYFPTDSFNFKELDAGSVPNFPIEEHYLDYPTKDYIEEGMKRVVKILKETTEGDILFFINSVRDGQKACNMLSNSKENIKDNPFCVVLAKNVTEMDKVYAVDETLYKSHPNGKYTRKVVMATNIAESSVTVKGIVHVIESGIANVESYDPNSYTRLLDKKRISKAQAIQRRGRAGRTQAGFAYNLYTKKEYEDFSDYPLPDIKKTDLMQWVFYMLFEKLSSIEGIYETFDKFIEPPHKDFIDSAINVLNALEIIKDNEITDKAEFIFSIGKLNIYDANMLFYGIVNDCEDEILDIAIMSEISENKLETFIIKYDREQHKKDHYEKTVKKFISSKGDHFTFLKIRKAFRKARENKSGKELEKWCRNNYISYKNIRKVNRLFQNIKDSYKDLKQVVRDMNFDRIMGNLNERILGSIFFGYQTNIAKRQNNKYKNYFPRKKTLADIKIIYNFDYIVYNELICVSGDCKFEIVSGITKKKIKEWKGKIE